MSSGERPIGAAKGKQSDTEALYQPPPPPPPARDFWQQSTWEVGYELTPDRMERAGVCNIRLQPRFCVLGIQILHLRSAL